MLADGLTKGSVNRLALQLVAEHGKHVLTKEVIRYTAPNQGPGQGYRADSSGDQEPPSDPPEVD